MFLQGGISFFLPSRISLMLLEKPDTCSTGLQAISKNLVRLYCLSTGQAVYHSTPLSLKVGVPEAMPLVSIRLIDLVSVLRYQEVWF